MRKTYITPEVLQVITISRIPLLGDSQAGNQTDQGVGAVREEEFFLPNNGFSPSSIFSEEW